MTNDPAKYRRLSEPFNTGPEADAAINAFYDDVQAARERHKIGDVSIIVEVATLRDGPDGVVEGRGISSYYLGSVVNKLPMLARTYGAARQEYEELLGAAIEAGRASRRR